MALGIYPGAGGVKTASDIYVGAGGVKTVKEVYAGVDGSVKKVWPAFKDYGGDSVNLVSNGYVDLYGYYTAHANESSTTSKSTHSGTSSYSSDARNYYGVIVGPDFYGCDINNNMGVYHYFSTEDIFDARGYNYMVFGMTVSINQNYSTSTTRNFQLMPVISFASNPDDGWHNANAIELSGEVNSRGRAYDTTYTACTFVDISNCNLSDMYLRAGYVFGTTWEPSSGEPRGYLRLRNSSNYTYEGIWLYKDKSDCNIDGSNYTFSFELAY